MTKRKLIVIATVTLLFCLATTAAAEPGRAARLVQGPSFERDSFSVRVPITVDLTGVTVQGRAVELGAYVVRIDFDPARVQFVEARPGTDFGRDVVTTQIDRANAVGWVKLTSVQAGERGPSGVVNLTNASFRELVEGGASSIRVSVESLASTLIQDGGRSVTLSIPIEGLPRDEGRNPREN